MVNLYDSVKVLRLRCPLSSLKFASFVKVIISNDYSFHGAMSYILLTLPFVTLSGREMANLNSCYSFW